MARLTTYAYLKYYKLKNMLITKDVGMGGKKKKLYILNMGGNKT